MSSPQIVDTRVLTQIAAAIGTSVMPDSDVWVNRFTVKSTSSSSVYTVAQRRSDGVWGCSCRGWTHHRRCKHLTDILERLATVKLELASAAQQMLASARTAYLDLGDNAAAKTPVATAARLLDL